MIQIVIVGLVALGISFIGNYSQWKRNGVLKGQLETVQGELEDAKAQEKAAADATRTHLREIDRLRGQATRSNRSVAAVKDDDCADRPISDSVRAVLDFGLHDNKSRTAAAPPAGRGKGNSNIRR